MSSRIKPYWHRVLDEQFLSENCLHYPHREYNFGLTKGQKDWLKDCWIFFAYYRHNNLQPRLKKIPETYIGEYWRNCKKTGQGLHFVWDPIYTSTGGFIPIRESGNVELHHIIPRIDSIRLFGVEPDNDPCNVIPLSREFHRGTYIPPSSVKPIGLWTPEDWLKYDFPHPDSIAFARHREEYGFTAALHAQEELFWKTHEIGMQNHNTSWDLYFRQTAEECVACYTGIVNPPPYPIRN